MDQAKKTINLNKRAIFLVAGVLSVAAICITAFLLIKDSDNKLSPTANSEGSAQTDISNEIIDEEVAQLRFSTTDYAYKLSEDKQLERIFEAKEGEKLTIVSEDSGSFYFFKTFVDQYGSTVQSSLNVRENGADKLLNDSLFEYSSLQISGLSPDQSKLLYSRTIEDESYRTSLEIGTIDVQDGEIDIIYSDPNSDLILQPLGFIDNNRLLVSSRPCLQCDAAPTPSLYSITISGELEQLVDRNQVAGEYPYIKSFNYHQQNSKLYFMVSDLGFMGVPSYEDASNSITKIYSYNFDTGIIEFVHSEDGKHSSIKGIGSNGKELIISRRDFNPDFDYDSPEGVSQYNGPSKLVFFDLQTKETSTVELSTSHLYEQEARLGSVTYNSDTDDLFFVVDSVANSEDHTRQNKKAMYMTKRNSQKEAIDLYNMIGKGNVIELTVSN